MQYQGHFTITKKDNIDFNLLLMRRKLVATSLVVFVIIGGAVGLVRYSQGTQLAASILEALLTGVCGVVLLTAINLIFMLLRINGLYKSKQLTDFSFDVVVDKDGVHSRSDRGNSDVPWTRILSIVETVKAYYIFITDSNANVLPKAQIADASGADSLRKLFLKNMPAKKCKLK